MPPQATHLKEEELPRPLIVPGLLERQFELPVDLRAGIKVFRRHRFCLVAYPLIEKCGLKVQLRRDGNPCQSGPLQIGTVQFLSRFEMTEKEFLDKLKKVLSTDLRN